MGRQWHVLFYILALVVILPGLSASAQVAREDPSNIQPSVGGNITSELDDVSYYLQYYLNSASLNLESGDIAGARADFKNYSFTCDVYLRDLWQLNISRSDYENISASVNATQDELNQVIRNSELYGQANSDYNMFKANGNITAAGESAEKLKASYDGLNASCGYLKSNVTLLEQTFKKEGRGTAVFDTSLNNLNDYVKGLDRENGSPGSGDISDYAAFGNATSSTDPGKKTVLTLTANKSSASVGDTVLISGVLAAEDGMPAPEKNVSLSINGMDAGSAITDNNGSYAYGLLITPETPAGNGSLLATYERNANDPFLSAVSQAYTLTIYPGNSSDSGQAGSVSIDGLPLVLFKNDQLTVTGTLYDGGGAPIGGKVLGMGLSGISVGTAVTDDRGRFSISHAISKSDPLGYDQLSIYGIGADGQPAGTIYSSQLVAIPYDMPVVVIATALSIIAVIEMVVVFIVRPKVRLKSHVKLAKPDRGTKKSIGLLPPGADKDADRKISAVIPAPFETMAASRPAGLKIEADTGQKVTPASGIDKEIDSLLSTARAGSPKEALTHIYLASRKITESYGTDVPLSMTHNEFYARAVDRHPSIAQPLSYIVEAYEKVCFARQGMSSSEIDSAVNDLRRVRAELEKEEAHR